MKKIIQSIKKHEKLFFFVLLIVFCLTLFSTYLFTTIPLTQGWGEHYVDLMSSGKGPYKDFYYYLPPLNLIIDTIFWKLSFGHMIIYQIYRLIERLAMISLIYALLCKVTKPRYACIGTCVGTAMFVATVYDLIGDYNQTCLLFSVILTYLYFNFIKTFNLNKITKRQYLELFLAGIVIGLSFLLKQPLFVAECLILFPLITACFIIKKKKNYVKCLLISILGILTPIAVTFVIMIANNSLLPFINQVYLGTSSKGSLYNILMVIFTVCFKYKYILISLLFSLYFYIKNRIENNENNENKTNKYLPVVFGTLLLSVILFIYNSKIESLEKLLDFKIGVAGLICIILMVVFNIVLRKKQKENFILEYLVYFCMIFIMMLIVIFKSTSASVIYYQTEAFNVLNDITILVTIGNIILLIYYLVSYKKTGDIKCLKWVFILAGGFVYLYESSMASIDNFQNSGAVIEIAILIAFILEKIGFRSLVVKILTISACMFICITVTSQKISNAYSWWGWSESVTDSSKKYSINVPGLEGYRVSYNIKQMYEEMYKVIDKNTNSDSVIYGFPHVKIFNVLTKNSNMNTFVPVPFYDVCPDTYAIKDAKKLENNNPDIVIWVDIPYAIEVHESIFRDGKPLGQRKIVEWFSNEVKNKNYILIGQYDSVYIYKLNDGTNINYKYIKDKKAINKTIVNNKNKK